jgi:outer membrane protein assembly factor BamE (lipoprotein component of BamABCDE complex)
MKTKQIGRITVYLIVVLVLMVVALKSTRKDSTAHFKALEIGMTPQQVVDLVGTPNVAAPTQDHATWTYGSGVVSFTHDKVDKLSPALTP